MHTEVVKIGVTGHRKGLNIAKLEKAVVNELEFIKRDYRQATIFQVISPLAEGADRIVAKKAVEILKAKLIVPLPFSQKRYKRDFIMNESKKEFDVMICKANEIKDLSGYKAAGHYMVDHSDIIFAIWDGEKANGTGGTAEIVKYAKSQSKKVIYFSPDGEKVSCSN